MISRDLDHPVCDCFYLALAEQRQATVITADGRLLHRLQGTQWASLAISLQT
jgi:predicted nucleic acid-binding protein